MAEPPGETRRDLELRRAALQRQNRALRQRVDAQLVGQPKGKLGAPPGWPRLGLPARGNGRAGLFVDVRHGLSNRLQALGSGLALARALGRRFVLLWRPSPHCDCRFEDLFVPGKLEVVSSLADLPEPLEQLDVYNYMDFEGGKKGERLQPRPAWSLLVRSAYDLRHPKVRREVMVSRLRGLRPVPEVEEMIREVPVHGMVGVHVRMAVAGAEPPPWEQWQGNWSLEDHEVIDAWRRQCSYERFIEPMRVQLEEDEQTRFFVCADSPEAVAGLRAEFGDRIVSRPVAHRDRSVGALQEALADLLLLSRTRLILGSGYSSFSRIARLLGGMEMRQAGVDF